MDGVKIGGLYQVSAPLKLRDSLLFLNFWCGVKVRHNTILYAPVHGHTEREYQNDAWSEMSPYSE